MIRSVAIILGDNDFGGTFRNLLETITNVLIYNENTPHDVLVKIIRHGLKFHYIAFQNQYDYSGGDDFEAHFTRIENYLIPVTILFDNEADQAFSTEDHDGGAWHLTVQTGQINSF